MTRFSIVAFTGAIASVFVLHIPVAEAAKEVVVVYSFCSQKGCPDGEIPGAGVINVHGTLYGTTAWGGGTGCANLGCGTVFSIDPSTGNETVLHAFGSGTDGQQPNASLIDVKGTLYGTTSRGGADDGGTVFSIDPATGAETVLYSFAGGSDGAVPMANLIDVNGTFYGTTSRGGNGDYGTVFSFDPATGAETVLYRFCSLEYCADGNYPEGGVIDVKGMLYGTTSYGGTGCGCGTVFSIDPATDTETVVYSSTATGGAFPMGDLIDVKGELYGTASNGGAHDGGVVFSIDPTTNAESVVYSFCSEPHCADGNAPVAGLIDVNGIFYGTTNSGGRKACKPTGCGVAFSVDSATGAERVLHSFCSLQNCTDGELPFANLIDVKGALYGTTTGGGANRGGTVFKLKL